MNRRFRILAALLALLSFSASFAEAVWASTCAPMDVPASAMPGLGMAEMMAMPGMDMPASPSPADDSRPAQAPECPLAALASSGCHAISIPAAAGAPSVGPMPVDLVPVVGADRVPHLLLAVSLFRPPRA